MCIIALSLALLAIVAGMMLMAQAKREALGSFFRFVSWFVVIVAFISILCMGVHGIMRYRDNCKMGKEHVGMMDQRGGRCMDSHMRGCCNMAMGSCGGTMMNGCGNGMMKGCNDGMTKGCKEGMTGSCRDMKNDSNCKMKVWKDSVVIKKKMGH